MHSDYMCWRARAEEVHAADSIQRNKHDCSSHIMLRCAVEWAALQQTAYWNGFGSACLLAAGSTPMSWLKGLKGLPGLNLIFKLGRSTRSLAKGA